jgi:ribosomal subunit interface protein
MEIIFKSRQTDVPARFRKHATAKLNKLERLDQKTIRIDVEVSVERNPRLASQKERVELTIRSRGPAIRAEAAAEDRFAALDLALAKLDSRLRRALDRRKSHYGGHGRVRLIDLQEADGTGVRGEPEVPRQASSAAEPRSASPPTASPAVSAGDVVPIEMEGDGPLVVRQKFHQADPMAIDQALLEMELVGHDFYLFQDIDCGMPSVVYRRRGYQYGVIRLTDGTVVGQSPPTAAAEPGDVARPDPVRPDPVSQAGRPPAQRQAQQPAPANGPEFEARSAEAMVRSG